MTASEAPPPGGPAALNLKQVAHALGVHYMTAYRYVRQGRLAATRVGTEWRVDPEALEAFGKGPSGAVGAASESSWAARLESCLLAADEVAAWNVIEAALAAGRSAEFCYTEMLAAGLASIGAGCERGERSIADQHVASAIALRLIALLGARFRRRGRSRGTFIFGAPTGELHTVPIALTADRVRLGGYDVLELGANVPPEAFAGATARVASRLLAVGIGVSQVERADDVRATVQAVRAVDAVVPVIIGGIAAVELEARALPGVSAYARDGATALRLLNDVVRRRDVGSPQSRLNG